MSVVHLAGTPVALNGRAIQRCLICGEKLADSLGCMVPEGDDRGVGVWPVGAWIEQVSYGGFATEYAVLYQTESPEFEGAAIPAGCCVELVERGS